MTALTQTMGSALWYVLNLTSLALVIGQLICLLRAVRDGQNRVARLLAPGNLLLGFCVFVLLMDCAQTMNADEAVVFRAFQRTLFALPWYPVAALETISAALLVWQFWQGARYRRAHLTPAAVRETVSLLPEGLSVSRTDGTILLSNLKMNDLCRALTGTLLSDANGLWRQIEAVGKEQDGQYLVRLPQGEAWTFTKRRLVTDEGAFDRIRATDVTERYRILEDLEKKNAHLQDIQRRMKAVAERSGDMFVAQEEANARVALHNQLGQVLLMGLQLIEHPERTDARVVRLMTQQMNAFLLGEAETPAQEKTGSVQDAIAAAASIGVTVELRGAPGSGAIRSLLAQAISECAANAVKHAHGDRLTVTAAGRQFTVVNNGTPPKRKIVESGGLLALRRNAEAAGGTMNIEFAPAFSLTIRL